MSPQLIEMYGIVKLDFVIIGSEVESLDLSRMEDLMRAANAAGTVPIVKIKRPDPNLIADVMNIGAPMVMVPHITTAKQLELMVRASRFEPEGLRGECPIARYNGFGSLDLGKTHDAANRAHAIIPIIEDADALDHLDEMMEVKDVDIYEVGPFDLSRSLGEKGQAYAGTKTMAALEKICAAAERHGKAVCAPLWHTIKTDSYPGIYARQMDELISRGVNCLYEIETAFMALHMTRLGLLREVRTIEDEPVAPPPAKTKPRAPVAKQPARKR
jgi:2-keto-3-deoxy-L-rhamnonate aldolase RhmA